MTTMTIRLGIDLGGTKIEILALAPDGQEAFRRRIPTPATDYDAIVREISALVAAADGATETPGTIGVGIPGTVSPATGLVKNANTTCLIGKPFDQDLAQAIGRPVRVANDADCFTLSEASDGAGTGTPIVFGVILGTGVGGGLAVNGTLLCGPNAITGEWGHNPLPWPDPDKGEIPGPLCYCGQTGCIETFLSGPGLIQSYNGGKISVEDVLTAVSKGEEKAVATVTLYQHRLAKALASVINIVDPHAIVLGGGLSNIKTFYDIIPRLWGRYVFSDTVETRLLPPRHGDASGVRGAAWLWPL